MAYAKRGSAGGAKGGSGMKKSSMWVLIGIGVVVVLAGVIAIGASGGGDTEPAGTTIPGQPAKSEFQDVQTTGNPLAPPNGDGTDLEIGSPAPSLLGYASDGTKVDVVPGDGSGPIMLVFLAHWCPHCNAEIPVLIQWKDAGLMPAGLRVVGVTTSSNKRQPNWPPSEWLEDKKWPFEAMADTETNVAANLYGVTGFPFIVVIDAEGKVKGRTSGEKGLEALASFVDVALAS